MHVYVSPGSWTPESFHGSHQKYQAFDVAGYLQRIQSDQSYMH